MLNLDCTHYLTKCSSQAKACSLTGICPIRNRLQSQNQASLILRFQPFRALLIMNTFFESLILAQDERWRRA